MNLVHNFPIQFSKIRSNIIHLYMLRLPSGSFPSGLPKKVLYAFLAPPMLAT